MVWVLVSVLTAAGWFVGFRSGFAFHISRGGSFLLRLLLFAVLGFPFAYWVFRREGRRELEKTMRRTLCPKCGTIGEANEGAACQCGGAYVPQSTMKWVPIGRSVGSCGM